MDLLRGRYGACRDDIDHIAGYINIKDILPFRFNLNSRKALLSVL